MPWENSLAYSMRLEEFKLITFTLIHSFQGYHAETKPGDKFCSEML